MFGYGYSNNIILPKLKASFVESRCSYFLDGVGAYVPHPDGMSALIGGSNRQWGYRMIMRKLTNGATQTWGGIWSSNSAVRQCLFRFNTADQVVCLLRSNSTTDWRITSTNTYVDKTEWLDTWIWYDYSKTGKDKMQLYVNGVLQPTTLTGTPSNNIYTPADGVGQFNVGRTENGSTNYFHGYFNQWGFVEGTATPEIIEALYNDGKPILISESGLSNTGINCIVDNDVYNEVSNRYDVNDDGPLGLSSSMIGQNNDPTIKDCNENPYS